MTSPTSDRKSKSSPVTPVWAIRLSRVPLHPTSSSSSTTSTTTTSSTPMKSPTENVALQHSSKASMGGLAVALIVLGLIVLALSVAAVVSWYCKTPNRWFLTLCARRGGPQQAGGAGDKGETEMWKHTDSDAELHSPLAAEDKADGKNASEVTLCINSETKTPTTPPTTTTAGAEE
ncbi:hypothetical protein CRUP_005634 [Coryphaenoides rupestris]|nr:hypothetical protein CRUP_005634 [Coryphaenoides rupestris]